MRRDVGKTPETRPDGLAAHLLRQRDADRFGLAVGVIGAEAEPHPIAERIDNALDLAARIAADHLYALRYRQQRRGNAIKDRCRFRPRDAECFELTNVRFERALIAPCPSGDDEMLYVARIERAFVRQ